MHPDDTTAERWLPIPGYEGWYEASDQGRIRRVPPGDRYPALHVLKPRVNRHGYEVVGPSVGNRARTIPVHILVALTFHGPRPAGLDINHRDGDKRNNAPGNLEYATRPENIRHSHEVGLQPVRKGERNPLAKLTDDDVREIRALKGTATIRAIGELFGIPYSKVSAIHRGVLWGHVT